MLFNSYDFFFLFLPAVFAIYWGLRERKKQNLFLLAASWLFYGSWDWRFLSLLVFSTGVDFLCGLRIHAQADDALRRRWLYLSLAVNLGVLGFFKYFGFFTQSAAQVFQALGLPLKPPILDILLPVGLSFYTLKAMSYVVDVYRRKIAPESDPTAFALFIAFFPQLVAGPIERAQKLLPQIQSERRMRLESFYEGGWLVLWGVFKKVVVADNLARGVNRVFDSSGPVPGPELVIAIFSFTLQLYCDFSGYSDIACGLGRFFGFELSWNFERPFFSRTIQGFFRRWHTSLFEWFKDYVYLPLCGDGVGLAHRLAALLLTTGLIGLWHGARWSYVQWGVFNGVCLALLFWTRSWRISMKQNGIFPVDGSFYRVQEHLTALFFLFVSMFLFRVHSLEQAFSLSGGLLHWDWSRRAKAEALILGVLLIPLLWQEVREERSKDRFAALRGGVLPRALWYLFLLYAVVIFGEEHAREYVYYQF
ncbi:MAG: MBOAT family O-acyltransferase [Elusimicrobiota bacterium]|jgi:D-alanyl-lipoteichoic acid acyltransferase DltB (MBOAT superfamily)